MKSIINYIETSCSNLENNHTTYLYKKKILERMMLRSDELKKAGMKDEKVILDILSDEIGNIEESYNNFLADEKKKRRRKMMKIGFPVGGITTLLLTLIVYFVVSDITGAWSKTWLIIVGSVFAMIIFYLSFAIKKLCTMRRIFHPIARILIAGCVMLVTVFAFLFCLMMLPQLTTWPIIIGGVGLMLIADLVFAFVTKQKFRTISLMVYMPAIATFVYIISAVYNIVTWSGGWLIILLGVVADIIYIISTIISNMKYFMYRQEVDE